MSRDDDNGPGLTAPAELEAVSELAANPDARTTLQGWRERGDDRLDPVGFYFLEALQRRATSHVGAVGQRLEQRLTQLLDAYAARLARTGQTADTDPATDADPAPPARGPLVELAAFLAYPGAPGDDPDAIAAQARRDAYPDLPALDDFRALWSGLSADRQVRQSQEQVHKNAGPLNSNQLVHRALILMRELSPGYLQQFMAYTEALAAMAPMTTAVPPAKKAPRAGTVKKNSRAKRH